MSQPTMRAKLTVRSVLREGQHAETVKFSAVYGGSTNAEDNSFASATPSAEMTMQVTNKALFGKLNPDDVFYVDFIPVPKPAPAV